MPDERATSVRSRSPQEFRSDRLRGGRAPGAAGEVGFADSLAGAGGPWAAAAGANARRVPAAVNLT
eukprot:5751238-Pyramimonas_sp.AAC.1